METTFEPIAGGLYPVEVDFARELSASKDMTPEEEIAHNEEMAAEFGIFVIFMLMFVGQLLHQCTHATGIPYTPTLTVFGLILGILDRALL